LAHIAHGGGLAALHSPQRRSCLHVARVASREGSSVSCAAIVDARCGCGRSVAPKFLQVVGPVTAGAGRSLLRRGGHVDGDAVQHRGATRYVQ
jgi:hypothetical protein